MNSAKSIYINDVNVIILTIDIIFVNYFINRIRIGNPY